MSSEYRPPSSDRTPGPNSAAIAHLREHGPATADEIPGEQRSDRTREVVARIRPGNVSVTAKSRPDSHSIRTIYYLYGDERRAVRRFIEEYPAWVASCMRDPSSPLHRHSLWTMFKEEWEWGDWGVPDGG